MRRHLAYARYVFRHKWFVFLAGLKLHVPILMLIFHDWDKFLPSEWFPYARTFYNKDGSKTYNEHPAFTVAWNQHQKINKHHWQYHYITWDRGESEALPMPDVYRREMLADWQGAGRALGKPNTWEWYEANKDKMKLHPETRAWIEDQLARLKSQQSNNSKGVSIVNRFLLILAIVLIAFLMIAPVLAQSPEVTPEPTAAPPVVITQPPSDGIPANVLAYLLTFFSGAIVGVTGVLAGVGRLKNDTAALNAIEWLGKSIPVDTLKELNQLGQALRDAGDVVDKVTDNAPNTLPTG